MSANSQPEAAQEATLCRYNEKLQRMQRGLEGTVDELFTYSCPKFVAATPPRLDNLSVNSNQEAYR